MPLTRDKIIGFDQKSMTYRFVMMNGNRPVECGISNAVFNYLEKSRYPTSNPDAAFLRWREQIEKEISNKFDSGAPDADSVNLFLKDFRNRKEPGLGSNGEAEMRMAVQLARVWTPDEDEQLRISLAAGETASMIATRFDRTTGAVRRRAEVLKLSWRKAKAQSK